MPGNFGRMALGRQQRAFDFYRAFDQLTDTAICIPVQNIICIYVSPGKYDYREKVIGICKPVMSLF